MDSSTAYNATLATIRENTNDEQESTQNEQELIQDIAVNELEGRVCYFSLAGDQALQAFTEYYDLDSPAKYQELKNQIVIRLYFAILMFDVVIMHCSDPLRSKLIKEILNEHISWIEEGRIRFIANKDIKNWQTDYVKYIDRKRNAYESGYFADLEAKSLISADMSGVTDLLAHSPYYIRKDSTQSSQFTELLKTDIASNAETLIIGLVAEEDDLFKNVKKYAIEKTTNQLLNAKYYAGNTGSNLDNVFDPTMIKNIFKSVRTALRKGQAIARPAIVEAIRQQVLQPTELQDAILAAVTLRMDLMYCRMNAGKHLVLEFHPSYEDQTLYRMKCFNLYLEKFVTSKNLNSISKDAVNRLINSPENIDVFRCIFLASMADTHEQNNFTVKLWAITTVFDDRCKRMLAKCNKTFVDSIAQLLGA